MTEEAKRLARMDLFDRMVTKRHRPPARGKYIEISCLMCGKSFLAKTAKYCSDCVAIRISADTKKYWAEKKSKEGKQNEST